MRHPPALSSLALLCLGFRGATRQVCMHHPPALSSSGRSRAPPAPPPKRRRASSSLNCSRKRPAQKNMLYNMRHTQQCNQGC